MRSKKKLGRMKVMTIALMAEINMDITNHLPIRACLLSPFFKHMLSVPQIRLRLPKTICIMSKNFDIYSYNGIDKLNVTDAY